VFVVFACGWIGLNVHCGWVRYHEFLGNVAFNKVHLPDELALAQLDPARWLSPTDRENIVKGKGHYVAASRTGFFVNHEALPKQAWFEYLLGDAERSVQTLRTAAAHQKDESKALSLYYRGAILNRLGRYDEARATLDEALAERDDLILARQEKGESLWQLGRRDEAVSVWTDAFRAMRSWYWSATSLRERRLHQASVKKPMCTKNKPTNSPRAIRFSTGCSAAVSRTSA
jgi:tetratricopeptide (TPR) repeat protein